MTSSARYRCFRLTVPLSRHPRLKAGLLAGMMALGLAGCEQPGAQDGSMGFLSSIDRAHQALEKASLAGGKITLRGPSGYCIEARSLRNEADSSFALLARCDVLSGGLIGAPVDLAVLTVTVTPYQGALPAASALAKDFPNGDVLSASSIGGVRLLQLARGGNARMRSADPRHWRGAFVYRGYLISMAAYGPAKSNVVGKGGRHLLEAMARATKEATRDAS